MNKLASNRPAFPVRMVSFLQVILILLAVIYLTNLFTPLRLHVDMLRYYAIKDCIEFGCPPDSEAAKDYLPYGYTGLLLLLSKLGILSSFTIVLINIIYLALSLYLVIRIFRNTLQPVLFVCIVLLNWTMIKFTAHPLSEMQYLFFSILSLYYFQQFTTSGKYLKLLFAFIACALAFLTRTVGIALVGALGLSLIWQFRQQILLLIKKNKVIVSILAFSFISVLVFAKELGLDHYTSVFTKQFDEGLSIGTMIQWHLTEWSEFALNFSSARIINTLPASVATLIFVCTGLLILVVFLYVLLIRKNSIPFIVKAYIILYSLLMFNWPFYDPRFWVPVIPLIFACLLNNLPTWNRSSRWMGSTYAIVYSILGIVALTVFTYTSINKKVFAQKQANGVYRNEYETHFYGKPQSDTAKKTDPVILNLLKRYD